MTQSLFLPVKTWLVGLILILVLADQLSKWWIIEQFFRLRTLRAGGVTTDFLPWLLSLGQKQLPPLRESITGYFDLVMAWNTGVSFSMFASDSGFMPFILTGVALTLSGIFLFWLLTTRSLMTALPLSLIIAGALSNVWDRVRFGAVADFLYFHLGVHGWPAFNLADSCIVLGVALLAYDGLFLEPKRKKVTPHDVPLALPDSRPVIAERLRGHQRKSWAGPPRPGRIRHHHPRPAGHAAR